MKKNRFMALLIVCTLLAAMLSACGDQASEVETVVGEDLIATQAQEVQIEPATSPLDPELHYCTLVIDTWDVQDGKLNVSTFTQATLPDDVEVTAQIELWRSNIVLDSAPITLGAGEEEGIYETDVSVNFDMPDLAVDEELQLWLTIDVDGSGELYSCGGWYLEDGQLMLIAG